MITCTIYNTVVDVEGLRPAPVLPSSASDPDLLVNVYQETGTEEGDKMSVQTAAETEGEEFKVGCYEPVCDMGLCVVMYSFVCVSCMCLFLFRSMM